MKTYIIDPMQYLYASGNKEALECIPFKAFNLSPERNDFLHALDQSASVVLLISVYSQSPS